MAKVLGESPAGDGHYLVLAEGKRVHAPCSSLASMGGIPAGDQPVPATPSVGDILPGKEQPGVIAADSLPKGGGEGTAARPSEAIGSDPGGHDGDTAVAQKGDARRDSLSQKSKSEKTDRSERRDSERGGRSTADERKRSRSRSRSRDKRKDSDRRRSSRSRSRSRSRERREKSRCVQMRPPFSKSMSCTIELPVVVCSQGTPS